MSSTTINTIMINALPLVIAGAVALYKFIVQLLPDAKHAQLASLTDNLSSIALTTVHGVEQFMSDESGQVKKAQAASDISAILEATGIHNVPPALIDNAIEAAVYSMNLFKPNPPTATQAVPAPIAPIMPTAINATSAPLLPVLQSTTIR